ncbi:unnamed protein product [Discosporangium mesarthrocarpum]
MWTTCCSFDWWGTLCTCSTCGTEYASDIPSSPSSVMGSENALSSKHAMVSDEARKRLSDGHEDEARKKLSDDHTEIHYMNRRGSPSRVGGTYVEYCWGGMSSFSTSPGDYGMAQFRGLILKYSIRAVVFDMDLTVTRKHSRGQLQRRPEFVGPYTASARDTDAPKVMRLCHELGLRICIATFQKEVDNEWHIGGSGLVRRVLDEIGAGGFVHERDVMALSPWQYKEMLQLRSTYNKNDMIRSIFGEEYSPSSTLLIDDTVQNVEAFVRIGGHGLVVEGGRGMALGRLKAYVPSCTFVPASKRHCSQWK